MEKQALDKLRTQVFGLYAGFKAFKEYTPAADIHANIIMLRAEGGFYKNINEQDLILLRSIDSLTEEEIKAFNSRYFHASRHEFLGVVSLNFSNATILTLLIIDYLRSIGIAIPYLGHSVEELVQLGIVKLKI